MKTQWNRKKEFSFRKDSNLNTQWVSLVTFKSDALWDSLANVCSNSTICKFLFSFAWVSWCKFSSSLANSSNFSWCCLQSEEGRNGILLPKLFWPTVRKNCSSDQEKTFEIRGWRPRICKIFEITRLIYSNCERSEQFLVTECFL